jgi:hypothetical protein
MTAGALPQFLRGTCFISLASGALVPLCAFFLAIAIGVLLRTAYDIWEPLPLRDVREGGRAMLQWLGTLTLGILVFGGLHALSGTLLPPADAQGEMLRGAIGAAGMALAMRAIIRIQIGMFTPERAPTLGLDPEHMIPTERDVLMPDAPVATPAPRTPPPEGFLRHSNVPQFLIGVVLLGLAYNGWKTDSLCLFRLPGAP